MRRSRVVPALCVFALLSVLSVSASAATPPASDEIAPAAPAETRSADLLCDLGLTTVPALVGTDQEANPTAEICGTCGQDVCDNRNVGAQCQNFPEPGWGWCISPSGNTCSDGRPNCQCATDYN